MQDKHIRKSKGKGKSTGKPITKVDQERLDALKRHIEVLETISLIGQIIGS